MTSWKPASTPKPEVPPGLIPGYRIPYSELEKVCRWLRDEGGWGGLLTFSEAVFAMATAPRKVYAIVYSNYSPAEVHSLYRRREDAEARVAELGDPWHVVPWKLMPDD